MRFVHDARTRMAHCIRHWSNIVIRIFGFDSTKQFFVIAFAQCTVGEDGRWKIVAVKVWVEWIDKHLLVIGYVPRMDKTEVTQAHCFPPPSSSYNILAHCGWSEVALSCSMCSWIEISLTDCGHSFSDIIHKHCTRVAHHFFATSLFCLSHNWNIEMWIVERVDSNCFCSCDKGDDHRSLCNTIHKHCLMRNRI